ASAGASGRIWRQAPMAWSIAGYPANRWLWSNTSSISSCGATPDAWASAAATASRSPRPMAADTRTSARTDSVNARLQPHARADSAYALAARVQEVGLGPFREARHVFIREERKTAEHTQQCRLRRARRAVLDLERNAQLGPGNARAIHALRTDLREDAAIGHAHQLRTQSVGAAYVFRPAHHRFDDARRRMTPRARTRRDTCKRARERGQRHTERDDTAAVHRSRDVVRGHVRPVRQLAQHADLHRMVVAVVARRRPAVYTRERQHARVLARAVVVQPRRRLTLLTQQTRGRRMP